MSFGHLGALGLGAGTLGSSGGADITPAVRLSASSLTENSVGGTAIGTLSVVNVTGTAVFTLVDSASTKIALSGTNNVNVVAGVTAANYEATPTFNFTVSVAGTTPALANATFPITVIDVNEFTPVITSNGGGASASISVAENTTAVTTVTATDADTAAVLTYSISGGADAAKFTINSSSGVLVFASAPDFETPTDADANNAYLVTVRVSDGVNSDTQALTVTVTDVADDLIPPVITSSATVSLAENSALSHALTANETVTWTKTGGADAALFSLAGSTLSMTAKDFEIPADADGNNIYVVQVTATDAASNTTNQTISVTVTDVGEGGGGTAGEPIGLLLALTKAA